MANILVVNSAKEFSHSGGKLNNLLSQVAVEHLTGLGHNVKLTNIDEGYDIEGEIEKILWADSVIYQQPGWWMGAPWILKQYMDDVFTVGHGKLYASDGRTRSDASKKYGSGGLIQGKTYMISATWNAPEEAFTDPDQFFEGVGVDGVYLPFHKANQFLGMTPLKTFLLTDVIKNFNPEEGVPRYKEHLTEVYGSDQNTAY